MQGLLDIEEQCRGFLELAKTTTALLVKSIFSDTAFVELFNKVCCSDDWKQGITTASILATLGDYLADFKRMLEEAFFKRWVHPAAKTASCLHGRRAYLHLHHHRRDGASPACEIFGCSLAIGLFNDVLRLSKMALEHTMAHFMTGELDFAHIIM